MDEKIGDTVTCMCGHSFIIASENKHVRGNTIYAHCPQCATLIEIGGVQVKVEGKSAVEVEKVTKTLLKNMVTRIEKKEENLLNKKLAKELKNDKTKRLIIIGGGWMGVFLGLGYFILQIATSNIDLLRFIIVIFILPILFTLIGAFILKTSSSLKEENFIKLIALTLKLNFKGLKTLTEVKPDGSN